MKKVLLLIIGTTFSLSAFAQRVNETPIKDIDVEYVQIVGTSKLMSSQLTIQLDFGQRNKYFDFKDTQVYDKDGSRLDFNSMVDALNFMSENGYDFVSAYTITMGNQNVYHYLLRKSE